MRNGQLVNLRGRVFGRWTVVGPSKIRNKVSTLWRCRCACGNTRFVMAGHLIRGATMSCGCLRREIMCKKQKHGKTGTKVYGIWKNMIKRCRNKSDVRYPSYGGRGISVCTRWRAFENFFEDMGDAPVGRYSIDRINNLGNYSPSNCRWATDIEQANNKRNNRIASVKGEPKMTVAQFSRKYGVPSWQVVEILNKMQSLEIFEKAWGK